MGMIVEKDHKIISFKQRLCLKKYIDCCSEKRASSKMDSELAFYKCLALLFSGKIVENIRNCVNVQFIQNCEEQKLIKARSKLSFDGIRHVYEDYTRYMFKNQILKMEEPIYLGFCILDLSKLLMYETRSDKFHQ